MQSTPAGITGELSGGKLGGYKQSECEETDDVGAKQ